MVGDNFSGANPKKSKIPQKNKNPKMGKITIYIVCGGGIIGCC